MLYRRAGLEDDSAPWLLLALRHRRDVEGKYCPEELLGCLGNSEEQHHFTIAYKLARGENPSKTVPNKRTAVTKMIVAAVYRL